MTDLPRHASIPQPLLRQGLMAAALASLLSFSVHARSETAEPAAEPAAKPAADTATGQLSITISGIKKPEGIIAIEVLRGEAQFDGEGSTASMLIPAQVPALNVTLGPLPAGEYAIRVMQDIDEDGKLKTNMIGMPKEPWGMSNNATGKFGPPTWKDARFALGPDSQQTIELR